MTKRRTGVYLFPAINVNFLSSSAAHCGGLYSTVITSFGDGKPCSLQVQSVCYSRTNCRATALQFGLNILVKNVGNWRTF